MSATDNMQSRVLKSDAPLELITQVKEIEDQSDKWSRDLGLATFTHDVAVWGALTQIILLIEQHIGQHGHGSQKHREAMINLGRAGALLIDELRRSALPDKPVWLKWTPPLAVATQQAVMAAYHRDIFISTFTMWHRFRRTVEIISPTQLRFSVPPTLMDRRIMAHQQGCRIPNWPSTTDNPIDKSMVDDPDTVSLIAKLLSKATVEGALALRYPDDSELFSHLRNIYDRRLAVAFRRKPTLDLGGYTLGDFRRFFAVLLSLCSVHEYLCDAWSKLRGRFPTESAVMVKPLSEWTSLITGLSNLAESQVQLMIADLSFGTIKALDIYISPFVPTIDGSALFLIPHFILNSRAEENILRVCSYARPQYYSVIANAKEAEMREDIKQAVPARYTVSGPLKLPDEALPDLDIVLKDSADSCLLLGELKWLRKSTRVLEYLDREVELEEGFRQLRDIRTFLDAFPDFLQKRGLSNRINDPLTYAVIARDHISTIQMKDSFLAEFDALVWALRESESLAEAVRKLQGYEWLPVEGRDFYVRFESSTLAGVAIETEGFHRP
jgi:hypothetical protein